MEDECNGEDCETEYHPCESEKEVESDKDEKDKKGLNEFESCLNGLMITYEEAMKSNVSDRWKVGMENEMRSLYESKTWIAVDRLINKNVLNVKFVFLQKDEKTFKARLAVRGYEQSGLVDEIYATVSKLSSLRIHLDLKLTLTKFIC
nr:uncharacterized protein LOC112211806 [Halyomorpha halys]